MNLRLARFDFGCQRNTARRRGIKFYFTFEEWVAWWEHELGPDWQEKRGSKRGQFCMARNGDEGPYASWNVKCLLCTENSSIGNRGSKSGRALINEEIALKIFNEPGTNLQVAKKFGVAIGVVSSIKRKVTWSHVTAHLTHPKRPKGGKGEKHYAAKLNNIAVLDIFRSTESNHMMARKYKVSWQTIWDIRHKRKWAHVTNGVRRRVPLLETLAHEGFNTF